MLIGFYLDENITVGPKADFLHHLKTLHSFDIDLKYALLNYETIDGSTRISPIFLLYLFYLIFFFIDIDLVRFVSMNIFLISPFIFYKCLKIKFKYVDRNLLFFFSFLLYLSPSFRGNVIWPESAMLGFLFFLVSIYYFLKFERDKIFLFAILNIIFLSIAAYIRPSYCLFSLFFFMGFYREYLIGYKIFILFCINILLSLPAFYYIFVLDVNFITPQIHSSSNLTYGITNKILIISSIIFFYLFPFLITIYKFNKVKISYKEILIFSFISVVFYFLLVPNFHYNLGIGGGGIFLHISHYFFNSNNVFFIISFFSIISICYILMIDTKKNFPLILILFFLVPQTHIFHKYYDPILLVCIPLLFQISIDAIFKKKLLFILSLYFFSFYLINLSNSLFIKF